MAARSYTRSSDQDVLRQRLRRRHGVALALFGLAAALVVTRAAWLQVVDEDMLKGRAERHLVMRLPIPAHRGTIYDRHGAPLAVSAPVPSVRLHPPALLAASAAGDGNAAIDRLADLLGWPRARLRAYVGERAGRDAIFLPGERHIDPSLARALERAGLPGVGLEEEYGRYYPGGEISAHVLGYTDIDERGQEGLELAFNEYLSGEPGEKRVRGDRRARVVEDIGLIQAPRPGQDLTLALDERLQYLAYRALKKAVKAHAARGGSVVVLGVPEWEVLAMANQPGYNPNNRQQMRAVATRNRAVVDQFEPGSTIKPFTVAAALAHGKVQVGTRIDTSPGVWRVGGHAVRDHRNYGPLDLTGILSHSSNVGAAKLAMQLPAEALWRTLSGLGFGQYPGSGFRGEVAGRLTTYSDWYPFDQAAHSFGYGFSASALQLAMAYAVLADDGRLGNPSFLRRKHPPQTRQVLPARVAREVRGMLESVVGPQGTAGLAAIHGYRVAGKTGTVRKWVDGAYSEQHYRALFAGMAPASRPRLVAVVMLDEPHGERYYGGQIAAPVFGEVVGDALRLLNITPDDLPLRLARPALPGAEG